MRLFQDAHAPISGRVSEVQSESHDRQHASEVIQPCQDPADGIQPHQEENRIQDFEVTDDFDEVVFDFGYVHWDTLSE